MSIRTIAIAAMMSTTMLVGAAQAENVLRWTSQGDALTLDPMGQNEGPTNSMNGQIYEPLVTRDQDMVLEPGLAESWKPLG
ncbi:MAG: ABC transporter substrate-binding protein, partial [Nisaea sp.]